MLVKGPPDCIKIGKVWSIRVFCIYMVMAAHSNSGTSIFKVGIVLFSCSILVIFELFEAFDL